MAFSSKREKDIQPEGRWSESEFLKTKQLIQYTCPPTQGCLQCFLIQ